jgi:hypothetical protein
MNGITSITTGCGVVDNSNSPTALTIVGNGTITTTGAAKTQIVGDWSGSGTISPAPYTHQPVTSDPFADMAPPSYSGCDNSGVNLGSHDSLSITGSTTTATVICGDISLSAQSSLTLGAGVYVVTGNITLGGQTSMGGTGVTIYLPNGGVNMAGGATVSLSAPTSGTWQGILFYQRRGNTSDATLVGGTNQQMNGVLYFPSSTLTYTGGSGTVATKTTLVSDKLVLKGNSYISASASTGYTGNAGGVSIIE